MTREIFERFLRWAKLKFHLHINPDIRFYFKEREIWWVGLGANVGYEEEGKNEKFERPVIIFKKFNRFLLWAIPLTTKNKSGKYYYQFEYKGNKFSAILSQLRVISSKRLSRKIRTLPKKDFDAIKKAIKEII